jgi:hypothetical protein
MQYDDFAFNNGGVSKMCLDKCLLYVAFLLSLRVAALEIIHNGKRYGLYKGSKENDLT